MPTAPILSGPEDKRVGQPVGAGSPLALAAGTTMSFILAILALKHALGFELGPAIIGRLEALLFGQLSWMTAILSGIWALIMFLEILKAYRRIGGFPWLASLSFAAAALCGILALHACLP